MSTFMLLIPTRHVVQNQLCREVSFKDKIKGRTVKRQLTSQQSYWVILNIYYIYNISILFHCKIKLVFVCYLLLSCVALPFSLPCRSKLDCPSLCLCLAKETSFLTSCNWILEIRFLPSFFPFFLSSSLINLIIISTVYSNYQTFSSHFSNLLKAC